jgi:hypothetical protein
MDKELTKTLSDHYQKGQGSIQDLARIYKVTVEEVLIAVGLSDMVDGVTLTGDLIDQREAGPLTTVNPGGTKVSNQYTVD